VRDLTPMAQYLIWAMEGRGKMSNQAIYREVKNVRKNMEGGYPPKLMSPKLGRRFRRTAPVGHSTTGVMIFCLAMAEAIGPAK
jgi:hypothetical protein